jgi:hypothetical protein
VWAVATVLAIDIMTFAGVDPEHAAGAVRGAPGRCASPRRRARRRCRFGGWDLVTTLNPEEA